MEASPHLHLVDTRTGEIVDQPDERDVLIEQLQCELKGKSLQIGNLKRELAQLRAAEPESDRIKSILLYLTERTNSRAGICPGGKAWEKVRARMRDKFIDRAPFTDDELRMAVDGALLDPWLNGDDPKSKGYLRGETIYRDPEQVLRLVDLAAGFEAKAGVPLSAVPDRVLRDFHFEPLLDVCACGHLRLEHSKADPFRDGAQPCLIHGCCCEEFDDFDYRVERWVREHRDL